MKDELITDINQQFNDKITFLTARIVDLEAENVMLRGMLNDRNQYVDIDHQSDTSQCKQSNSDDDESYEYNDNDNQDISIETQRNLLRENNYCARITL